MEYLNIICAIMVTCITILFIWLVIFVSIAGIEFLKELISGYRMKWK